MLAGYSWSLWHDEERGFLQVPEGWDEETEYFKDSNDIQLSAKT